MEYLVLVAIFILGLMAYNRKGKSVP